MSREQIEERIELSDIIDYALRDWDDYIYECQEEGNSPIDTFEEWIADAVLKNGYRKQEWISVDERLPEENTRVLVYLNIQKTDANIYTFFDTDRILNGKWVRWNKFVSHWMPLPEAPKMKGGAE